MKISIKDLIKKGACKEAIKIFKVGNWENYDFGSKEIIIKNNSDMFENLVWLAENFKIPNFKITFKEGNYWCKYTYNEGLKIKHEDSNNYWEIYIYNDKNLLIKCEDSDNYWRKYEYNDKNLLIKYESSNKKIVEYEYIY